MARQDIARVAIDVPLRKLFDYLPPAGTDRIEPGCRVSVRFGRKKAIGVVVASASESSLPRSSLRRVDAILDEEPLFGQEILALLDRATRYYVHPPGEVCAAALPVLLRKGRPLSSRIEAWCLTADGRATDTDTLRRRAPKQAALVEALAGGPLSASDSRLLAVGKDWRAVLRRVMNKGLVECATDFAPAVSAPVSEGSPGPVLTDDQQHAVDVIAKTFGGFHTHLLFGVTGSGKTEVYLRAIAQLMATGCQALIIVPEIGLTPQLVDRFRHRLGREIAVLHSGLSPTDRLASWRSARAGEVPVVIGTRSAIFTPMQSLGLIVVDEEHDPSLKQQDGFRYSARDLAVMRGQVESIPVVLGTATPSLETLNNARRHRYGSLMLPERPGHAVHPDTRIVDLRTMPARNGLTATLLEAIDDHLAREGQVILFLNRRGYATSLMCTECGWVSECPRCDSRMTLHQRPHKLRCHHCGREARPIEACPDCGTDLIAAGQGTERVEDALARHFPDARIARIDRDTTRSKGAMDKILTAMRERQTDILVGTQMLTKGHDFPHVTLVGVLNADQGLFGTDFRSDERLAQNILQVSGRAGRSDRPGEVLIQTAYPEHPLLMHLIQGGYERFADAAMRERLAAAWPPFSHLVLIRAESHRRPAPTAFLERCRALAEATLESPVAILGPAPSPMEKLSGRYRAQLLARSTDRVRLHARLARLVEGFEKLPEARHVRWSVDVDPVELF